MAIQTRPLSGSSRSAGRATMWQFSPITHDWSGAELMLPQALRGMGQQFAAPPPIVTLTPGGLAMERLRLASGLFNLMRNLGGAIGIAVCATILNDRTNLHFYRLAEHLTRSNDATNSLLQGVASNLATWGGDQVPGESGALRQLWNLTYREALTLTLPISSWPSWSASSSPPR